MARVDFSDNVVWLTSQIGLEIGSPLYQEVIAAPKLARADARAAERLATPKKQGVGRAANVHEGITPRQWDTRVEALARYYANTPDGGEGDDDDFCPFSDGGINPELMGETVASIGRVAAPAPKRLGMLASRAPLKRSRRPLDGGMDG